MLRKLIFVAIVIVLIGSSLAQKKPRGRKCSLRRQNVVILPGCTEKVAVCSGTCGTGHSFLYYSLDPETKQTMKNSRCLCCRDTKLRRREIQCNGETLLIAEPTACDCENCE